MVTTGTTELLRWIIVLPAAGSLLAMCCGRRAPGLVKLLGPGVLGGALALSVVAVLELVAHGHGAVLLDRVSPWIEAGGFRADATLRLDALSAVMLLVVTGVGFLIHVYSVGYMGDDPDVARFFCYLNLFVAAMLVLVLADNLLLLFVGWEGVGLCSYLLIGFWYTDMANASAGKKAFLVNRIGDAGFVLGLFVLVAYTGTLDVSGIEAKADVLRTATLGGWPVPLVVGLLLLVGAAGKSAQIPLYVWLPDAMAGPTPVSALIHAATMVTAGVYMVARMHAVYALSPEALTVVATLGTLTALLAALIGTAQFDIKKVLAYSTVSQLGIMFLGLGTGMTGAAIFHVVTHAFFKGLLFLGAGSVIHGMGGEQDMRRMGGLRRHMPVTFWTMLVGTLAIAGVPPLSGFFSKDEIIWGAFTGPNARPLLGVVAYGVAFLTAFYMGRLLFMTFFGERRAGVGAGHGHGGGHGHGLPHESPLVMTLPLVVLALLSAGGGFLPVPAIVELVTGHHGEHAHAPLWALALATAIAFAGLGLAWLLYVARPELASRVAASFGAFYGLVADRFRVDELYDRVVVRPLFHAADALAAADRSFVDGAVNGAGTVVSEASRVGRRLQTGNVQHYALGVLVGALALVLWVMR